ncbi:DUF555 domain-containing protein [Methanolobus zinderi]|jgi:hypothetical protein|uniref:UPF0212 protein HWN40_07885 n=1 Tax=Methanolobus zinderi TaxID=536044 RepID=A0A7D5I0Y7_9EURY|nr:DUF555 domain-containing protein [Methanolobus zinderi]QLC50166.1 DUF555 domain-containing protein [Methanolobus zinderi]
MPNYHVILEAAWLVRDVKTADDAIGVAISEAGKRLNPKLDYVEVDIGTTFCPSCSAPFSSVFLAANTAIVGLVLEMKVFDAESDEHAARIAKSVIGRALRDVPLDVVDVQPFDEESI